MPAIPPFILKKLYVKGSLRVEGDGFALDLKNTIAPAVILGLKRLELDETPLAIEQVAVINPDGQERPASGISPQTPLQFPLGAIFTIRVSGTALEPKVQNLKINVEVQDVGPLDIPVADQVG